MLAVHCGTSARHGKYAQPGNLNQYYYWLLVGVAALTSFGAFGARFVLAVAVLAVFLVLMGGKGR